MENGGIGIQTNHGRDVPMANDDKEGEEQPREKPQGLWKFCREFCRKFYSFVNSFVGAWRCFMHLFFVPNFAVSFERKISNNLKIIFMAKKSKKTKEISLLLQQWAFDVANHLCWHCGMRQTEAFRRAYAVQRCLEALGSGKVRLRYYKRTARCARLSARCARAIPSGSTTTNTRMSLAVQRALTTICFSIGTWRRTVTAPSALRDLSVLR